MPAMKGPDAASAYQNGAFEVNGVHQNGHHIAPRILVVGVGPHAQKTYIPKLESLRAKYGLTVAAGVDVEAKRRDVVAYAKRQCPEMVLKFVPFFTYPMPLDVREMLDGLVRDLEINAVIIATEPLAHMAYAMWAIDHSLHILMDKPITTREGAAVHLKQARGIAEDFHDLLDAWKRLQKRSTTAFLVSSHRRYNPLVGRAIQYIKDTVDKTGCGVTGVNASYCDGTFRLPIEVVEQEYHTYNKGFGKVSHSGYHIIDLACYFASAGTSPMKKPSSVDVVSNFVMPRGFFHQMRESDYQRMFGAEEYTKAAKMSEVMLREKVDAYGEIDAAAQLSFFNGEDPIALAQITLSSSGYGLRSTLMPAQDQYKGNGRVKHEAYEIRSGPFQTIYLESKSIKDCDERCEPGDYAIGANNHFQMTVFRNHVLTGHAEPMEVLHLSDLAEENQFDHTMLYTEQAKNLMIEELLLAVQGKRTPESLTSNITSHTLAAEVMSAMYVSHVQGKNRRNPVATVDMSP